MAAARNATASSRRVERRMGGSRARSDAAVRRGGEPRVEHADHAAVLRGPDEPPDALGEQHRGARHVDGAERSVARRARAAPGASGRRAARRATGRSRGARACGPGRRRPARTPSSRRGSSPRRRRTPRAAACATRSPWRSTGVATRSRTAAPTCSSARRDVNSARVRPPAAVDERGELVGHRVLARRGRAARGGARARRGASGSRSRTGRGARRGGGASGSRPRRSSSPSGIVALHRTAGRLGPQRCASSGPTSTGARTSVAWRSVPSKKTRSSPPGSRSRTRSPRRWTAAPRVDQRRRSAPGERGQRLDGLDEPLGARAPRRRARVRVASSSPVAAPRASRSASDRREPVRRRARAARRSTGHRPPPLCRASVAIPRSREALSSTPRLRESWASSSWASSKIDDLVRGQQRAARRQVRAVEGGVDDDDVGGSARRFACSAKHVAPNGHRSAPGHSSAGIETRDHARGSGSKPEVVALAGLRRRRPRRDPAQLGGDAGRGVVVAELELRRVRCADVARGAGGTGSSGGP